MENSKINWTDHTHNQWIGCTQASEGCRHCYAAMQQATRFGRVEWGSRGIRQRTSDENWRRPLKWNREALEKYGRPARVFCANLADVCDDHPSIKSEWRSDLALLVDQTPNLIWMFLSKRPHRYGDLIIPHLSVDAQARCWFGASIENESVLSRIDALRQVPASIRFLSLEPLLGPLPKLDLRGVHWVIVGGESGPGARPMQPDWVREIRNQCVAARVPFFFKQWGGFRKKENGRDLDGRMWNECPVRSSKQIKQAESKIYNLNPLKGISHA